MGASEPDATPGQGVSATTGSSAAPRHFPHFDSLRAIAALAVLAYHIRFFSIPPSWLNAYVARLDVGVTIFFVISGFLLYRPFARARLHRTPRPSTGPYAWRRALRIIPAFWVALLIVGVWIGTYDVLGPNAPIYFGFAQVYWPSKAVGGIGQAWSLAVEVTFYAFLPLWAYALGRIRVASPAGWLRSELLGLGALVAISFAFKQWFLVPEVVGTPVGTHDAARAMFVTLPRFIDQFALGMGLAVASVWLEGRAGPSPIRVLGRRPAIAWLLAALAFWAVSTQVGPASAPSGTGRGFMEKHYLYAVAAFFLVVPAVIGDPDRGGVRRLLGNRALTWVGVISYSVYLWQLAVVEQLSRWGIPYDVARSFRGAQYFVFAALAVTGTLAVAAASYYAVERPAIRFKPLLPRTGSVPEPSLLRAVAIVAIAAAVAVVLLAVTGSDGSVVAGAAALGAVVAAAIAAPWLRHPPVRPDRGRVVGLAASGAVAFGSALVLLFNSPDDARSTSVLGAPSRTHLVATFDGTVMRLFVDGDLAAKPVRADVPARPEGPLEIGALLGTDRWRGVISDVAVYRRALAPTAVRDHDRLGGNGPIGPRYARAVLASPGLLAYWPLRRGAAAPSRGLAPAIPPGARVTARGVNFDGRQSGIVVGGFDRGAFRKPFSVEVWARARGNGPGKAVSSFGALSVGVGRAGQWSFATTSGRAARSVTSRQSTRNLAVTRNVRTNRSGAVLFAALIVFAAGGAAVALGRLMRAA